MITSQRIAHIALTVGSLHQAENLYRRLFGMEVRHREGWTTEGNSCSLLGESDDAQREAAGIVLSRSLLEWEGLCLLLQQGTAETPTTGRLTHIGLRLRPQERFPIRTRAQELGCRLLADTPETLLLEDTLGVRWRLTFDTSEN